MNEGALYGLARRVHLSIRLLGLALRGRWLTPEHVGISYDRLAPRYDDSWLVHIQTVTDRLVAHLPARAESVLDLGCGTGYMLAAAARRYPEARLTGVDVSRGMMEQAARRMPRPAEWVCADMLDDLRRRQPGTADLVTAAWSIGYSNPAGVIAEAGRILPPGGSFAFVVNTRDTLGPVFETWREMMRRYPGAVNAVTIPRFPRRWEELASVMERAGLRCAFHETSSHLVRERPGDDLLAWLTTTGILAGFDRMLSLDNDGIRGCFEARLRWRWRPLYHHYIMATGVRQ